MWSPKELWFLYKCGVQKGKVFCMNVESKRVKISEQNKIDGIVQVPWESISLILVWLSPFVSWCGHLANLLQISYLNDWRSFKDLCQLSRPLSIRWYKMPPYLPHAIDKYWSLWKLKVKSFEQILLTQNGNLYRIYGYTLLYFAAFIQQLKQFCSNHFVYLDFVWRIMTLINIGIVWYCCVFVLV